VLVRQLQGFQALAGADVVVFDKTGTLTSDGMAVTAVHVRSGTAPAEALRLAAALARHSLHPASRAVQAAAAQAGVLHDAETLQLDHVAEVAGQGVQGRFSGLSDMRLGSAVFCEVPGSEAQGAGADTPQVHLAGAMGWIATFDLSEDIRPDARDAIAALRRQGVQVHILSGDRQAAVNRVAAQLGLGGQAWAQGGCSPADKLARLQQLQSAGHHVAMVGDGLNDGPVLAGAHVSFAFGSAVPLARAQSDFVVLGTQLMQVPQTLALARCTLRVVRQNLAWAAGYNAVCVPLALAGWLPAWLAGLGMAASSLLVVLNAARLARPAGEAA
jgi:Cu2+-exporting ATPase